MSHTKLLLVAMLALCRAPSAFSDDRLEHQLETRNAASSRKFDSQAHEYKLQLTEASKQAQAEAEHNSREDTQDAAAYADDLKSEHKHARRKTALVLTTIAAALAGGGELTYSWASSDQSSIQAGGYATAGDINSAADMVNVKQGVAFGAWGLAGLFTAIALGLAL